MTYQEWLVMRARKAQKAAPAAGSVSAFNMEEHRARMEEADRVLAASRARRERERALLQAAGGTVGAGGKPVRQILPQWQEHVGADRNLSPLLRARLSGRISDERWAAAKREGRQGFRTLRAEFGGDGPVEAA